MNNGKQHLVNVSKKTAFNAMYVYYRHAKNTIGNANAIHWYMDGSSVGGYPSELIFLWSPRLKTGFYAPVIAMALGCY